MRGCWDQRSKELLESTEIFLVQMTEREIKRGELRDEEKRDGWYCGICKCAFMLKTMNQAFVFLFAERYMCFALTPAETLKRVLSVLTQLMHSLALCNKDTQILRRAMPEDNTASSVQEDTNSGTHMLSGDTSFGRKLSSIFFSR